MTMSAEVQRLDNLFKGVAENINRVAEAYVQSRDEYGQQFEDELVDRGYEKAWLRCVYDIGLGLVHPGVVFLSPDKREVLSLVSIKDQKKALDEGINGHAIDDMNVDELRQSLLGGSERKAASPRAKKEKPPSRRWVANVDGVRHLVQSLSWEEELKIIEHAIVMGYLTVEQMKGLSKNVCNKMKT